MPGVYIRQGKYSEAEPLCQRALAIDEKALGPNHPNVATNLNNLAELYRAQGKYSEAESLYQRALAIDESIGAESMDLPLPHKREFEVVIMIESATGEMVLWKGMSRGHFSPCAGQDADAARASSHSRCTRRLLLWPAPGPLHGGLLYRGNADRVL